MIDKKLDELGKYVEEIEKKEPFNLLKKYIDTVDEALKTTDDVKSELELDFGKEIAKIIDNYRNKGLSDSIVLYYLFNILVNYIKNTFLEQKASELEIDRTLYKQQMMLLFKGKWKY